MILKIIIVSVIILLLAGAIFGYIEYFRDYIESDELEG